MSTIPKYINDYFDKDEIDRSVKKQIDKSKNRNNKMKTKYIECNCSCSEHSLRFMYFEDEHFPIYINTFLGDYDNIFKRIWTAIKYIFGKTCKYGYFGEALLFREQVQELIDLLEETKLEPPKRKSLEEFYEESK